MESGITFPASGIAVSNTQKAAVCFLAYPMGIGSAPGMTRTCDTRFRKPLLYPLSYGGGDVLRG